MELPKNLRSRAEPPLLLWLSGGAAIGVLVVSALLALHNTRKLAGDAAWVSHSYQVIAELGEVLSLAKDAETGQRGYLLTEQPRYLDPYNAAVAGIDAKVAHVEELTRDNPRHQANLPELRRRIDVRFKTLGDILQAKTEEDFNAARQVSMMDRGKEAMDSLRELVGTMTEHERSLLRERVSQSASAKWVAYTTTAISGVASIASIVGFLYFLRRFLRQRSEAAFIIAEQAERLRTTLRSIGDAVITTDIDGRVINMNPVAESLTGWSSAEARDRPLVDVFNIINETTRKAVDNPANRALEQGVVVGLANHTILIARDGRERPIDDSAAPIRCQHGELVGCVLVFRDISERKRAEEALRTSEERFRLALSADRSLGWWDVDVASGVAVLSDSYFTTLGFIPEAGGHTTAKWMADRLHPADRESALAAIDKAKRDRSLFTVEHRLVRTDNGETVWVAPWGHYRYDEAGNPVRFVGVFFDITTRKNREEELRRLAAELSEADRRKDEFLSILAHELRNPLAPLRNGLQIMRLTENSPSTEETRAMMERQLAQMVRLVDDLLDVSRINSGNLELFRERINLRDAINSAFETSKPVLDAGQHELTFDLPVEEITIVADVVRLSQVFANLLNNAAKYSNEGSPVTLAIYRDGNDVVVSVKDQGIGIPTEMLPRIFDMFTQVDRSLEKSRGGLGIGLSLVRRLVDLHGGSVKAFSEGLNCGAEFRVRLPIAPGISSESLDMPQSQDGKPAATARRILVADDNVDAAKTMAMMLKIMGNEVRTANDGVEAVDVAREFRPELVLLDIGMPRLNGLEACERIRQEDWGRGMTIVALTGWGQEEDKARSLKAGFDEHLVKPVEPPVLARLLAKLGGG